MSRHRRVNKVNLEYSDCESQSSSFTDDDYGASPNTMALYMFDESKMGNTRNISNFIKYEPDLNISEDCFPDQDDVFQMENLKISVNIDQQQIPIEVKSSHNFVPQKQNKVISNSVQVEKEKDFNNFKNGSKTNEEVKASKNRIEFDDSSCSTVINKIESSLGKPKELTKKIIKKTVKPEYDSSVAIEAYEKLRSDHNRRPLINLIVVGHVDAGKSTLMGNLLCKLNYVSDKKIAKYKHEAQKAGKGSFAYAWVLDESNEERERGITTDVAQTYFETENRRIQLLDAPGHRDFIPNMIGGAAQADAAILVINASKGEFETGFDNSGGQTREHTRLIRVLGVSNIIVAINKMDCVDWDESRFNFIREKLDRFLKSMKLKAQFCALSGLLGTNLVKSQNCSEMPWLNNRKYSSLVELIDKLDPPVRSIDKPLRLAVVDIYKSQSSSNYVISGRLESGAVSTLSANNLNKVLCLPSNTQATVKSIKLSCGASDDAGTSSELNVTYAFDGDHVLLSLQGVDVVSNVEMGSVICSLDFPMPCSNRIRVKLLFFGVKSKLSITKNYCVTLYYQKLSIPARFEKLLSVAKANEEEHKKPRCIPTNEHCSATVDLKLDKSICIDSQDNCKRLSKFTLRYNNVTIAGGSVIKVLPPRDTSGSSNNSFSTLNNNNI